jgi:DNA-binding transcriptional LysR family regulator
MLPSNADIHYFLEIASTLNLSRAAERLGVSQPALSLAIKRLEESLGHPLILRGRAGVQLTPGGRRFLSRARTLVEQWDTLLQEERTGEAEIRGRYTLGAHPSVALLTLDRFLPPLLRDHPRLELKFVHDVSRRIAEEIIAFRVDLGLVVNPPAHPDLVIRPLFTDEFTVWTAAGGDASTLLLDPELAQSQRIQRALERRSARFGRLVTSSSLEVIASMTARGVGVGILPARVARRQTAPPLEPWNGGRAPRVADLVCLVCRAETLTSPGARRLLQSVQAAFAAAE